MKKIYSFVLMAVMLLISTNTWAVDVASWADLETAIATPNAEITLTANCTIPAAGGTFDFNGAVIDCGASYLMAGAAKTYTLQNVTLKNYTSTRGAIYISKANAIVNLKSTVTFNFTNKYGVYANVAATINNETTIGRIYVKRNSTINNDGAITVGVVAPANYTATVNNSAGASFTQTLNVAGNLTLNNSGTAVIESGTFSGVLGGSDITIHGGTFNVEPTATGTIDPIYTVDCRFVAGIGSLDLAAGYVWRAFDGRIVQAQPQVLVTHANSSSEYYNSIEEAFANIQNNDKITLQGDVTTYTTLWLGTADKSGVYNSVTLDLKGHTLSSIGLVKNTIRLSHGALFIKNSVPGQGGIVNNYTGGSSQVVFITGSPDRSAINPRNAAVNDLFAYLLIDEGVELSAIGSEGNGFSIDIASSSNSPELNYTTNVYYNSEWTCLTTSGAKYWGVANGVRVDVKGTINAMKYAGKVNGYVRHPNEMITQYPCVENVQIGDTANSAFIHIFPMAVMHASEDVQATAVYSSGYGRWLIEGTCQGATGVYVKSGVVDLTDAIVESTYTGTATISTGQNSGVTAGGNAVVIESNSSYTGQQAIVIGGDTKISTEATGGAAVVDVVDDAHETKVESITINGGTFIGGEDGYAIIISQESATSTETEITVNGVTFVGETEVGTETGESAVNSIVDPSSVHITEIENPDGTTTVIVSAGSAPAAAVEWTDVAALADGSDAKWTGFTPGVIGDGTTATTKTLGELQIISGNSTDGVQQLTIKNKATLKVNRLIMNEFARIIVEAGGNLIVVGEQGINAPSVENILLQTSESAQAHFLFHPSVTSNRHPNATVELLSKSYYEGGKAVYQRFGIPTYNNEVKLEYKNPASSSMTKLSYWDYAADAWHIGWIDVPAATGLTLSMSVPFGCMDLTTNNAKAAPMSYLFKGGLVGNSDAAMTFNSKFNPYANSYMAPIDIKTLVNRIADNYPELSASVYIYKSLANDNYVWLPISQSDFTGWDEPEATEIAPMQAYMLYMIPGNTSEATISYKDNIYDPYMAGGASPAPARRSAAKKQNFMKLNIADENGIVFDNARLLEDNQFSDEFDNGYDINKYMNSNVSLYVTSQDEAWNTLASDNVLNAYIGVNVAKAGTYTISVAHNGLDYALVDLENKQVIELVEGNTYSFFQEAGKNDARFQVVKINKVPTAIEDVQSNDVLSTKIMKDGVLYIIKNGAVYNAQGQMVK